MGRKEIDDEPSNGLVLRLVLQAFLGKGKGLVSRHSGRISKRIPPVFLQKEERLEEADEEPDLGANWVGTENRLNIEPS